MKKSKTERLLKSRDPFERMIAIKFAAIEIVVKKAETEENKNVAKIIVQRLNEEKESDIVKESYAKLANAKSWEIRKFVAENAPIEIVVKMAETEKDVNIAKVIVQRLNEKKESDIVRESYAKLANAKSRVIRKFVAENAPIEIVVKMAEVEEDYVYEDVAKIIVQRLNEEKESDIVKESYAKLANAKSCIVREFVAVNAPIEIVVKMAETEEYRSIAKLIIQRLDGEKKSYIVREVYAKFANSKSWKVRMFVVENAPIEVIVKMAETEYEYEFVYVYEDFAKLILQRLNEEKDSDIVKENYAKLAKAKHWKIREFVAENAPIEVIVKMAETEEDEDVAKLIVQRLISKEKKSDIVKEIYARLANAKFWEIRMFVAVNAPIEIVVKMAKTEEDEDVAKLIIQRLTKDKDMIYEYIIKNINKVSPTYIDSICIELSKSEKIEHRLFVAKNASKSILSEMLILETDEKVLLEMLKRI